MISENDTSQCYNVLHTGRCGTYIRSIAAAVNTLPRRQLRTEYFVLCQKVIAGRNLTQSLLGETLHDYNEKADLADYTATVAYLGRQTR